MYIPLFGKALVSAKGIILSDKKAEEIWSTQNIGVKGRAASKWLAYYMAMRAAVFDEWVAGLCNNFADCVVLHLGCGLDSRVLRLGSITQPWYDIDLPAVICERHRYYAETHRYNMVSADLTNTDFIRELPPAERAIVVMEGVSMYLTNTQLTGLLSALEQKYKCLSVLMDCYTPFAAKMSKIKNPINTMGKINVYGVASPEKIVQGTQVRFAAEHKLTPDHLVRQLQGNERRLFKALYAGRTASKLYKLYEYQR